MRADSGSPLRVSGKALRRRLASELELTDWRGVIVVIMAAPGLASLADRTVERVLTSLGIDDSRVERCVVSRDAAGRKRLQGLNRGRDRLLERKRLIELRVGSAAELRFLREVAPDLVAALDLFVELTETDAPAPSWTKCRKELRALMEQRHATLDFTGLLPASVEQRQLPLDRLYQDLIEFRVTDGLFDKVERRGWLVLGHPGTGKTTYVRHLAWTYARGRGDPLELGELVPVLLPLSDYGDARAHERVRGLVAFLPHYLTEQGVPHAGAIAEHLPEVLLLLDGLDELQGPDVRRAVLNEIGSLLADGRIGAVVVTGRSFLVDELGSVDHLRMASTRPPTPKQLRRFVRRFVRLRNGNEPHARELIARIQADADLRALARTPLMLAFMVILDELEGRLPDRRIEIYYRLGEMLVDRWTRARSLGAGSKRDRPTRADAMRVLGPLAWWTLERGGGFVPETALLAEIERIEAKRETADEAKRRAAALLELLRSDTALLVPRPGRRWSFVHLSIAEYFAAVEVERNPERWDNLLDDPFRPDWREIVLFCAGQLGVIDGRTEQLDRLIDAVLNKARRSGRYDAKYSSLLIGLLAESPGLSRRQIDRLVGRLFELAFTMSYSIRANFQIQGELVELLRTAKGSVRESLGAAMSEWLSGCIRWDRVFVLGGCSIVSLDVKVSLPGSNMQRAVQVLLGHFVLSLVEPWVSEFGIDLEPTLTHWDQQPEWLYHLAAWWVRSDPSDRERSIAESINEI